MTNQATAGTAFRRRDDAASVTAPDVTLRLVGAILAFAIATVHIADQGGVTELASPAWIGWGYRMIEVGAVLTALALLLPRPARPGAWTGWAAGVLLGIGPFLAYVLSRTVGLPGDTGDVGNWGYWVGTLSLFVEAALMVLSVSMLLAMRPFVVRDVRMLRDGVGTLVRGPLQRGGNG
jgi:hypothetical protein